MNKRQVYCKERIQTPKSRLSALSLVLQLLHLKDKTAITEDMSKELILKDSLLSM